MAELEDHVARLNEIVQACEALEEGPVRELVFDLLEHIDHVHRSAVWRLFQLVSELGGKGLVERVALDPSVKLLFMLYDVLPVDAGSPEPADSGPRREVLRPPGAVDGFVPLDRVGGRRPAWRMGAACSELPVGAMRAVQIGGTPVLLCATAGGVHAFRNGCRRGGLPLHLGRLVGNQIECPWHGCRYDVRTGKRVAGTGADLEAFPVSVADGVVYVALNAPLGTAPPTR